MELYRDVLQPGFQKDDLKIVVVIAGWMGAAIYMNQERIVMQRQQQLNECLIELTKCYFADTVLFDKMIAEVVVRNHEKIYHHINHILNVKYFRLEFRQIHCKR